MSMKATPKSPPLVSSSTTLPTERLAALLEAVALTLVTDVLMIGAVFVPEIPVIVPDPPDVTVTDPERVIVETMPFVEIVVVNDVAVTCVPPVPVPVTSEATCEPAVPLIPEILKKAKGSLTSA